MSSSLCKASVYKAYQDVINDVISNTREHFMEDGVDEAVLQELKQLWQTKLTATKAVEENKEPDRVIGVNTKVPKSEITNNGSNHPKNTPMTLSHQVQMPHHQQQMLNKQVVGQVPPNNHMPQGRLGPALPEWRPVPIQLTIPSSPGIAEGPRILSIDVPEVFLQGPHLKSILTGQVIGTTMGLPLQTACAFLQDHVNAAFVKHQHQQAYFAMGVNKPLEGDQPQGRARGIPQGDGPADSSDEDDRSEERSENDTEEEKEDEDVEDDGAIGPEEDPLNSGDDVSDADGAEESFETDNVIVCQYDKITRSRNRWKFHLKDGIMNLRGQDFIFQKANGDAEW